jgi:hypothetical protein
MAKYLSNRQQNLKIGIVSYTENNTVLEITGNVGIGTTNATHDLDINGDIRIRGALYDKDNQEGTSGQLLVSTATGVDWQDANAISVIQTLINTSLTGIEVKEEGVGIGTTFTAVNFVSSNITATASGNQAIITLTDSPSFTNANVTGVSTIGTVKISSGIITATSGIVTYYGDGQYLDLTNNPSTGIGIGTTGGVVGYGITFLDLKGAGVSSTFYNSSVGIATIFFEGGGGGGGGSISISTTAPTSPGSGDLWYSPDYGRTFIYYDESTVGYGTDAFWVDAAPFNVGIITSLTNVSFAPGSAVSPSMFFVGDSQTGFFSPTPGQNTFVSVGSSILNINPSGIRVTGVSTFSSVNVTGNVSIGGTLTYDDVTNVDSIGLVTARTGVRIDAGGLVVTAGVSTFTNGPVLIGSATSTGTASQRLQVTGGAYVSGSVGIGTTTPTSNLQVVGNTNVSGVVTAFDFYNTAEYPNVRPTLDLAFAQTKILDSRITFTRASTATYVGANGLIKTAGVDEARFDHDPSTGESLGLLIEESRTNLFKNSSVPCNDGRAVTDVVNGIDLYTITANAFSSAYNSATAPGNSGFMPVQQGLEYVVSFYAKKVDANTVTCRLVNSTGGLLTGTGYAAPTFDGGRVSVKLTCTVSGSAQLFLGMSPGLSVEFGGLQLEAGSFPTSYIPTTTAAVTRSADVASISGSNFSSWYRQSEGTVFVQVIQASEVGTSRFPRLWSISDGTFAEAITGQRYSDGRFRPSINDNSVGQAVFDVSPSIPAKSPGRFAYAFKLDDIGGAVNGGAVVTDTSATMPLVTRLDIGDISTPTTTTNNNGPISRLTYWPVRLPNAQLQTITL